MLGFLAVVFFIASAVLDHYGLEARSVGCSVCAVMCLLRLLDKHGQL